MYVKMYAIVSVSFGTVIVYMEEDRMLIYFFEILNNAERKDSCGAVH